MKDENIKIEETKEETSIKTVELKKPVEYNGVKYEKLEFDFDKLTGKDLLNIGAELRAEGKVTFSPIASSDFIATTAVRACTADIGIDIYPSLSMVDAMRIENLTRNFLLGVE